MVRLLALGLAPALLMAAAPVTAAAQATIPAPPPAAGPGVASNPAVPMVNADVEAFMARRPGTLVWFRAGGGSDAAAALSAMLRRAPLDGLASGPTLAANVDAAAREAATGDKQAIARADRVLSAAWISYLSALRAPPPGVTYADRSLMPLMLTPQQILERAAYAPSLTAHLTSAAAVNPIYAQMRDAAWNAMQRTGVLSPDYRTLANLARARALPPTGRYVVVNAATQQLSMIEGGRVVDQMKVIVGTLSTQTPMLASTIWYATLKPYWYVPTNLGRSLIAKNMLKGGGESYLKTRRYEVLSDFSPNPTTLTAKDVNWKAVAAGTQDVYVRQGPGPGNSMGNIKFPFPNEAGVYLHDTPSKELFAKDQRTLSNGCVRLEDAQRLSRWLFGREVTTTSDAPEQHVRLDRGVPVFLTYLTAQPQGAELAFAKDVYGRDVGSEPRVVEITEPTNLKQ